MATVYIALGSNLGDRQAFIHKAIGELNANGVCVSRVSTIIETAPVDCPLGVEQFLNAVIKTSTSFSPEELHEVTQAIEARLGRDRKVFHGPRTIDIDILLYDDVKLVSKKLVIPHLRMYERDFVMGPLKEIL